METNSELDLTNWHDISKKHLTYIKKCFHVSCQNGNEIQEGNHKIRKGNQVLNEKIERGNEVWERRFTDQMSNWIIATSENANKIDERQQASQ